MDKPLANTSDNKISQVIGLILDGLSLRDALKKVGVKPFDFAETMRQDKAHAMAYARAVEIKADLMANEIVALADGDNDPAKVRNQMQARQWLASKLYAKRYGERIDLNVQQTIDVSSTLAEARARLLPIRDQSNIVDAEIKIPPTVTGKGETDKQSAAPRAAPNIFS